MQSYSSLLKLFLGIISKKTKPIKVLQNLSFYRRKAIMPIVFYSWYINTETRQSFQIKTCLPSLIVSSCMKPFGTKMVNAPERSKCISTSSVLSLSRPILSSLRRRKKQGRLPWSIGVSMNATNGRKPVWQRSVKKERSEMTTEYRWWRFLSVHMPTRDRFLIPSFPIKRFGMRCWYQTDRERIPYA